MVVVVMVVVVAYRSDSQILLVYWVGVVLVVVVAVVLFNLRSVLDVSSHDHPVIFQCTWNPAYIIQCMS